MQQLNLLARLPLAEGVFALWRLCLPEERLQAIYQQRRGRCYEKAISFPLVVQLLADALCQYGGSGRASFEHAQQQQQLEATVAAAYGKLRRMPIAVSEALVQNCSAPLGVLYPATAERELPPCVQGFEVMIVDGKAIKRVAKRLKVLRGRKGGVLGGRALVSLSMRSGLAVAMVAHPDGEINDVRLLPQLLPQVRQRQQRLRLWIGDRGFCDLKQPALFCEGGDHFLVRQHRKLHFMPEAERSAHSGQDAQGRQWVEDWGWVGSPRDKRRRYVRRIRLRLSAQEELTLLTSLLEAQRYPAAALLELYRQRWGIERVFQQVTEVFGLQGLIGSSPQASVFQLAFCLMLYNLMQVLRGYVAAGNGRACEEVSVEKLFEDVERELVAWSVLGSVRETTEWFARSLGPEQLRRRLSQRVGRLWRERWKKAPPQQRRARVPHSREVCQHTSVHRILEQCRRQQQMKSRHEK